LACRVPMGQASEPARFPGPLFLVSLGLVAARSLGNYTESRHIKCEMKALWMNPGVRELAALSALAALACGLAAGQGDLRFCALFGAASIVTVIEGIRRLRGGRRAPNPGRDSAPCLICALG